MSHIYEVLVDTPALSMIEVAQQVASAMGIRVAVDQVSPRQIALAYERPLIVTTADYDDEGPTMLVSRYNYSVFSWDLEVARTAFNAIAAATDWPIALFNEQLYQITKRRDPLAASA